MGKRTTLEQRARNWTNAARPGEPAQRAMRAYIAGHRAGSRLTKPERDVIEAATAYASELRRPSYKAEAILVLSGLLEAAVARLTRLKRKAVRR